ncbi:MAG: 4'-phosphopantetheinyl transferase superfamily protein [bacterium]|nr:4'-phosphopantetheinyl transferase superfamily protein [bacterium]
MKLEIHAVRLNPNQKVAPYVPDRLINLVDPLKQGTLRSFTRKEDAIPGLFGHLLVRSLIRQKTGLANHQIRFGTNKYGKPFLKHVGDFHFNISHSGDWVVAAIDVNPVGIDIEEIQSFDLSISRDYFSPKEHLDLMAAPDRPGYFCTLWCLKESYIKLLGKGLSHPLNDFSIRFNPEGEISIKEYGQSREDIFFNLYNVDPNYRMGLCATHNQMPGHVNILTMEQLTRHFGIGYGPERTRYRVLAQQSREDLKTTSAFMPR